MFRVLILLFIFFSSECFSQDVYVKGYYRNGKYIQPHYRSRPNSTINDNWSTKGNINPYTGKKGYISRKINYFRSSNEITYSQNQLYFIKNCVDIGIDEEKNRMCTNILINEASTNLKLKNELILNGLFSDYKIFGIDTNLSFEKMIGNDIESDLFRLSEIYWISNQTSVYESEKMLGMIDLFKWDKLIFSLPKYNTTRLKEISPYGFTLIKKNYDNRRKFHRKLLKHLKNKFGEPINTEGYGYNSFYAWIGLNFKLYLNYDPTQEEFYIIFNKSKIFDNANTFNSSKQN